MREGLWTPPDHLEDQSLRNSPACLCAFASTSVFLYGENKLLKDFCYTLGTIEKPGKYLCGSGHAGGQEVGANNDIDIFRNIC